MPRSRTRNQRTIEDVANELVTLADRAVPSDLVAVMASLHARLELSIEHCRTGDQRSYRLTKRGTTAAAQLPSVREENDNDASVPDNQGSNMAMGDSTAPSMDMDSNANGSEIVTEDENASSQVHDDAPEKLDAITDDDAIDTCDNNDQDQASDDVQNEDNESVDENPVKRRRICAAEATESMKNYSQSVLSGNGAKNNKGGVKPKPVPQKVFDAYQQALAEVLNLDDEDITKRLNDYFEEKDLSPRSLPPSASKTDKDNMDLFKHFAAFTKGQLHAFKGKVLTNMGAYRFYCKMTEMHEAEDEEHISMKQYAEDYCKEFGDDVDHVYTKMRTAMKIGARLCQLVEAFEWCELVIFFPEVSAKSYTEKKSEEFWERVPRLISLATSTIQGDVAYKWSSIYNKYEANFESMLTIQDVTE